MPEYREAEAGKGSARDMRNRTRACGVQIKKTVRALPAIQMGPTFRENQEVIRIGTETEDRVGLKAE